jgi:hypothetical protein
MFENAKGMLNFLSSYPKELKPIIDNFWKVYATIIAFYFGSRAAEEIAKKLRG